MAASKKKSPLELDEYDRRGRELSDRLIEDFFNLVDTPRDHPLLPAPRASFRYPADPVPMKPAQKMQRGERGLDYIAVRKESLNKELTKQFSKMHLSNLTSMTSQLNISAATVTSVAPSIICDESHRRDLPIFKLRNQIIQTINENPVTLISGQTGSGKSTQVPQYIYDYLKANKKSCKIAICQPRKIAAITIAHRVADDRGVAVGGEVGYQISLKREHGADPDSPTGMLFCTTGVLLQQLIFSKSMARYTHILLDEVHEREVDTDFLLILLKTMLADTPNVKIVLLSATMDNKKFQEFFKVDLDDGDFLPPVIDLSSEKRPYPVTRYYIEDITRVWPDIECGKGQLLNYTTPGITDNLYDMAASLVIISLRHQLATNDNFLQKPPSILVFLPGLQEIESLHSRLVKPETIKQLEKMQISPEICVLHSSLSTEEQRYSFVVGANPKIILSTNIAESGVTIPNVSHVIDFCLTKYQEAISGSQISTLITAWASKNNCTQRAGRAGRVCKGTVFRLVQENFFMKRMPEYPPPEMLRVGLESVVLKIKKLNMGSPLQMLAQAMDPPDLSKVIDAVLHLKELGALTKNLPNGEFSYHDGELTYLGSIIASLPVDVRIAKLIVLGYLFSVLDEAIIIGAGLNLKSIFTHAFDRKIDCYVKKLQWADGSESDCIAILNAYTVWHNKKYEQKKKDNSEDCWCNRHFLDKKSLQEMKLLIDEIKRRLDDQHIRILEQDQPVWEPRDKIFIIKVILAGAFGAANFFVPPAEMEDSQRDAFKIVKNKDLFRTVYFKGMNREIFGDVYEERLRQMLIAKKAIGEETLVDIEFDYGTSEKIYLTFESDPEAIDRNDKKVIEKVMPEVYRCVKLRQLDSRIFLNTMTVTETLKYAGEQGLGLFVDEDYLSFKPYKNYIKHPEWCVEPTTMTTKMHGYVTHVSEAGRFFFRPVRAYYETEDEIDDRYADINNEIQKKISESGQIISIGQRKLNSGHLVIVETEDSTERGRLLSLDDSSAEVYLIDCGTRKSFPLEMVFIPANEKIKEELLEYPPRIFECTLTEVQPSSIHSRDGKWTPEAIKKFRTIIDKKATIRIYSVVNGVASVQLYTGKKNWNFNLVRDGFAEEAEESYTSKLNHEFRIRNQRQRQAIKRPEEEFKERIDKSKKKVVPAPPEMRCHERLRLQGPYSPLEMVLRGISRMYNGPVNVEVSSVNSVVLNESMLKFREKFCVASNITVNPNNNRKALRDTTMMPSIPGLAVIIALIFSPDAQLRRDETKYRYMSVLTGLGYDAERNQPLYGERDAALNIDFELTNLDMDMINDLRCLMSTMLLTDPDKNFPDLVRAQKADTLKQIQTLTLAIFGKNRNPLGLTFPEVAYNWNVDQTDIVAGSSLHGDRGLFSAINFPELLEIPVDHKMELLKHAHELERCVTNMVFMHHKFCKLCNFYWDSTPELELHLFSKKHLNRVQQLSD